jgi:hypothetical protein
VSRSKTVAPTSALSANPTLTKSMDRITETWDSAKAALSPHVGAAREAVAPHLTAARVAVAPYVEEAGARVTPVIDRVAPRLDEARAKVTPVVETAVERFGPAVETAVDTARTRLRDDVAPAVVAAVETARETSAPARAEAKERAANALLALQGRQRKTRRWPFALAGLAAGAIAGIAASSLTKRPAPQEPVITPTPFPGSTPVETEGDSGTEAYPAGRPAGQ